MTEQSTRETLLDKLSKLLRLAKSSNQHEAELAMSKANELMQKHQIAHADIVLREATEGSIKEEHYVVDGLRMKFIWVYRLARGCAVMFDGECVVISSLHKTEFYFVGYPKDLLAMKMLFEHLYQSWFGIVEADLSKEKQRAHDEEYRTFAPRDTMLFKQGHGSAYADALFWRCRSEAKKRHTTVAQSSSDGRSLVVLKDDTLKQFEKDNGYVSHRSHASQGDGTGREYGARAGNSAALGGAINGGNKLIGN